MYKISISNFSSIQKKDLHQFFSTYGNIKSMVLEKGQMIIEFLSYRAAQKVFIKSNLRLQGRSLQMTLMPLNDVEKMKVRDSLDKLTAQDNDHEAIKLLIKKTKQYQLGKNWCRNPDLRYCQVQELISAITMARKTGSLYILGKMVTKIVADIVLEDNTFQSNLQYFLAEFEQESNDRALLSIEDDVELEDVVGYSNSFNDEELLQSMVLFEQALKSVEENNEGLKSENVSLKRTVRKQQGRIKIIAGEMKQIKRLLQDLHAERLPEALAPSAILG